MRAPDLVTVLPPGLATLASLALLAFALAACAEDIRPIPELDGPPAPTGPVATVDNGDGTYTTRIDATSAETWRHVDLTTGTETDAAGAWDVAAQRFHIKLNGGISGTAGVETAPLPGMLPAVTAAPAAGWITDEPDGDDENPEPDYAFEQGDGWYAYDPQSHVLTPRELVWVIRTGDGAMVKLAIERYYDEVGTSGVFTVRWGRL
jgi:hypothetical protein